MKKIIFFFLSSLLGFAAYAADVQTSVAQLGVKYSGVAGENAYYTYEAKHTGFIKAAGDVYVSVFTDESYIDPVTEGVVKEEINGVKYTTIPVSYDEIAYIGVEFVSTAWNFTASIEATPIELGVEYSGKSFEIGYFKYTAEKTGKLVSKGNVFLTLYTDETFTTVSEEVVCTNSYNAGSKETQIPIVEGQTYYVGIPFEFDNWYFTLKYADASSINLVSVTPTAEEVFPLGDGGQVVLQFDNPIICGSARLSTGATVTEISGQAYAKEVVFDTKDILFSWLKNGIMKAGDIFTLTIEDVKSATDSDVLYNGDGKLQVSWIACAKPAEVVAVTAPDFFLSYWDVKNLDGLMIIEYDAELFTDKVPQAYIFYGSPEVEGNDYYQEYIVPTIDGKKLILDFRGKIRTPANMVQSGTDYGRMGLRINGIKSADGQEVFAEGKGNHGSYQHFFEYKQLTEELATEFLPAPGSSIVGVSSVELWLSNPNAVYFDGVNVSYKSASGIRETVDYTLEQCDYKNEGEDGIIMHIPLSADMQAGTNVTITLTNLVSVDGVERDIKAVYNVKSEFYPIKIDPIDNSIVKQIDMITLTYDRNVTVAEDIVVPLYTDNGRTKVCDLAVHTDMAKTVYLVAENYIVDEGYYVVNVPAGAIKSDNGELNEELILHYEILPNTSGKYIYEPEAGSNVESLSVIKVNYSDGFGLSWNYVGTLTNAAGTVIAKVDAEEVWPELITDPVVQVILTLKDPSSAENVTITEEGVYTLTLPGGYFNIGTGYNTEDSPEQVITYVIGKAGVEGIFTDQPEHYDVYSINGVHILSTAVAADLYNLPAGLYIINGKKVYFCK